MDLVNEDEVLRKQNEAIIKHHPVDIYLEGHEDENPFARNQRNEQSIRKVFNRNYIGKERSMLNKQLDAKRLVYRPAERGTNLPSKNNQEQLEAKVADKNQEINAIG